MRQLASFLLVAFALPALAADVWRWKDDKGVVHYSDTEVPGAERVTVAEPPTGNFVTIAPPIPRETAPQPAATFRYSECAVTAPGNDQVFNAVNSVTASLSITPELQPGDRIQVFLDSVAYAAWPASALTGSLKNVYRGTHTLSVKVVDARGRSLCAGEAITFHVQQPSQLAPRNRPPKKP
jgi:hypothetical protein